MRKKMGVILLATAILSSALQQAAARRAEAPAAQRALDQLKSSAPSGTEIAAPPVPSWRLVEDRTKAAGKKTGMIKASYGGDSPGFCWGNKRAAAGGGCFTDDDCSGDAYCTWNICVDRRMRTGVGGGCFSDSDCAGDAYCTRNICVGRRKRAEAGGGCLTNDDCGGDARCSRNICLSPTKRVGAGLGCFSDNDCTGSLTCRRPR